MPDGPQAREDGRRGAALGLGSVLDVSCVDRDRRYMARALMLAARARRLSPPNPWVGALVVRDDVVVGEGWTQPPGGSHAEADALVRAGDRARGATLYTTLEPCDHHGYTPPCTDAIVTAGVARVVAAVEDPDPVVAGRGHARLRAAGVALDVGVGEAQAAEMLAPYLHQRRTGRAFCVLKTATSLDGRTAAADGSSRWITGTAARADAHALRADSQAVMVGAGTALADRPSLTVRDARPPPVRPTARVLLDGAGRVPADGPLFDPTLGPTVVFTTEHADAGTVRAWAEARARVEVVDAAAGGLDLLAVLETLARDHGVVQVLCEGGATLHASLLRDGLADRVVVYVAPVVLGDRGRPAFAWPGPDSIDAAPRWALAAQARVGEDVRLDLVPNSAWAAGRGAASGVLPGSGA